MKPGKEQLQNFLFRIYLKNQNEQMLELVFSTNAKFLHPGVALEI